MTPVAVSRAAFVLRPVKAGIWLQSAEIDRILSFCRHPLRQNSFWLKFILALGDVPVDFVHYLFFSFLHETLQKPIFWWQAPVCVGSSSLCVPVHVLFSVVCVMGGVSV